MIKLLYFANHPAPYRDENLNRFFVKYGSRVFLKVIYLSPKDIGHSYQTITEFLFEEEFIDYQNRTSSLIKVINILSVFSPDVILVPGYRSVVSILCVLFAKIYKKKLIYSADTVLFEGQTLSNLIRKTVVKLISVIFDGGFVTGSMTFDFFYNNGFSNKPLSKGAYAIDTNKYKNQFEKLYVERSEIKKKYNLNPDNFVFVYSGRFVEIRNLSTLLVSFSQIVKKYPFAILLLVGEGELDKGNSYQLKFDNIKLIKPLEINKIGEIYTISNCYILPSYFETYSVTIIHAACYGIDIISSKNVGANLDLINSGYFLRLFDPFDTQSLILAMEQSILEKRSKQVLDNSEMNLEIASDNLFYLINSITKI